MRSNTISLAGRSALITGSTRGIGRAIAEAMGRAGARLTISSSRPEAVAQTVQELQSAGLSAIGLTCDVSQREQVLALRDAALDRWGTIDIWVNNAGVAGPFGYTLDVPVERWEQVLRVNVLGCYYGCTAVLPHMLERRYGKIINLSGGGARRAQRFLSAYSTSKAAIMRFSDGLARDYRQYRFLSINVLEPGIVPTDMITRQEAIGPAADSLKALPRVMEIFGTTAEEAGELALWMASDATHGISGNVYSVMPRRRAIWRLARAVVTRRGRRK